MLTDAEQLEMRRLATMGFVPDWGSVSDRESDPKIPIRRSQIFELQQALLRCLDELEQFYKQA
jgi:hypothetical protein